MIDFIEEIITQVDPFVAYLILFGSAFIENTFPPIPGDTVTVIGAYLITTGKLSFTGVWFSTTLGSVLGFMTMFIVGLKFGRGFILHKKREKYFSIQRVEKAELWFYKYGYWIIFANRFLSGTRSVISIFAGIFKLNWFVVLSLSLLSALIWNGALMYAGYMLGVNWANIKVIISNYNQVVIIITIIMVIGFISYRIYKKRVKQNNV